MRPSPNGFWLPVCIAKVVAILIPGSPLCRGRPLKGLSRMTVTCHVRFLGGLGAAMPPGYPVLGQFVIFYDITGFQRRGFLQIISIYRYLDDTMFSGKVSAHLI